jgi:serine phosphatase RsbU (regulator of sigma subunit)
MTEQQEWDAVLLRQLKRAGLAVMTPPTVPEGWAKFLRSVQDHYRHIEQDRSMLNRSMEISTQEMTDLKHRLEDQRDQMRQMIVGIAEALGWFSRIVGAGEMVDSSSRTGIHAAKRDLFLKLAMVFHAPLDSETTSHVSGIQANLMHLADDLVRLVSETASQASLRKELEVASTVQNMLVPPGALTERNGLNICAFFRSAAECGGDWWGLYDSPEGGALVTIGDVTGHGVAAAIITGAAKAACDVVCLGQETITLPALLRAMNTTIFATAQRHMMMTCVAMSFDPAGGRALVANAGHQFPYQIRNGVVRPIVLHGQPLGANPDTSFETLSIDVLRGDTFVWFTDGIIECENEQGEQFGERRLRSICQRTAPRGPVAVRDAVMEAVDTFRGDCPQGDDITLVVGSVK